jgi:hypothetical protein
VSKIPFKLSPSRRAIVKLDFENLPNTLNGMENSGFQTTPQRYFSNPHTPTAILPEVAYSYHYALKEFFVFPMWPMPMLFV